MRAKPTPHHTDIPTAESSHLAEAVAKAPPAILRKRIPRPLFITAVAIGIGLRIWVSTLGYNFDFESYAVVASIIDSGGNVYAETNRYNYGPVWMYAVHAASQFAGFFDDPIAAFGLYFTILLTLGDLGLCLLLKRRGGDGVALLFFLNPISIIITGYHRQFGNLALLLGLVAADLFDRGETDRLGWQKWLGMAVLALSLATKHLLFAFPWWLAVKQRRPFHRFVVLVVPVALFMASFLPFWHEGSQGITDHVFFYRSFQNAPLWNGLVPPVISAVVPATVGLLLALTVAGLVFRRTSAFASMLLYTAVLLVFSPAMANQYLALAMPFVVWFLNPFGIAYTVAATLHLMASSDGLALISGVNDRWLYTWGFTVLVGMLLLTVAWIFYRDSIIGSSRRVGRWLGQEIGRLFR